MLVGLPVATAVLSYPSAGMALDADSVASTDPPAFRAAPFPAAAGVSWFARLAPYLLPVWSLGVLVFSVRLIWGCSHAFALGRRGQPADAGIIRLVSDLAHRMGIQRRLRVLISALAEVPSVVGALRPIMLLPAASVLRLTPVELEAVIAHELAHVRRLDYLVNMLQMIAETLFFYHPVVWWASKRIRIERELCCDDLAVRVCGDELRN